MFSCSYSYCFICSHRLAVVLVVLWLEEKFVQWQIFIWLFVLSIIFCNMAFMKVKTRTSLKVHDCYFVCFIRM